MLDVVSLSWWCCHRCHIHITNQDRLVTRSSHVRTPYATHCTKTWEQPSTAQKPFNATTHSRMQMDPPLVCSWLTSSLYPWPRPPMTILTSQSGTPTQCNTSWSLHNDSFLRLATFVCGFVQMWLWPGEERWEGNDSRWHPWSWTELGIVDLAAQEPKDHHKECHWPLPQYKRRGLPLLWWRERARFRFNLGPHGTKNTQVSKLYFPMCGYLFVACQIDGVFQCCQINFSIWFLNFLQLPKHCIPFTFYLPIL